jgi:hypothetical protein
MDPRGPFGRQSPARPRGAFMLTEAPTSGWMGGAEIGAVLFGKKEHVGANTVPEKGYAKAALVINDRGLTS